MNKFTSEIEFNGNKYYYCDLQKIFNTYPILKQLPICLKVLLETNIRNSKPDEINDIINIFLNRNNLKEINFFPTRVIMKEASGLPSLVELSSLEKNVEPQIMFDLVMDSSLDESANNKDIQRNKQRHKFIKWAQNKYKNFTVIPPRFANCDRVNLEYLSTMLSAKVIDDKGFIFPETIVGTDIHTTMINALGVFGLKVDSLQAQGAILGDDISLNFPKIVGVKVIGSLSQGVSISDAKLSLSNILIDNKCNSEIIEFYGDGLRNISLLDRASLSNSVSENGAVCGYFAIDENTIEFVEQTRGVDASLIKEYYQKQGLYSNTTTLEYDEYITFDLSLIRPVIAGPKKLQDKINVEHITEKLESYRVGNFVKDNDIVLSEISSFSFASNPTLFIQAGLLAKRACELGLSINRNIKKVFLSDSLVIKDYLEKLDLLKYLEKLGFYISIGDDKTSKDLLESVVLDIEKFNLNVSSLTSKANNFEEHNNSLVKSKWLMSPALVLAYSLKGSVNFDITKEPINSDIYLSDLWPSIIEVNEYLSKVDNSVFVDTYKDIFSGDEKWQELEFIKEDNYVWNEDDTYVQSTKYITSINTSSINIENAKILALLDDDISSELLSPLGQIPPYSPTSFYLEEKGLKPDEFNTFESRIGNAEVMVRGTLANIRLQNKIVSPKDGGYTKDFSTGEVLPIYEFSQKMKDENRPLVIFAGENFGSGVSRQWASKGLKLLGIKAVIAKSFDSLYKSNLIHMGILPLEFIDDDIENLHLKGDEIITIKESFIKVNAKVEMEIRKDTESRTLLLQSRLDTIKEVECYKSGGTLPYLLEKNL